MRTAGRIYDFTLTAGGSMQLLVQGDYMRIMSSTGAVEVLTDHYRIGPIMAGQGQAKSPFTRLTIIDRSGAGNVGNVLVADSDFIDNRINGDVSVIDGEKSRTLAGGMYSGTPNSSAAAGLYSVCQLWNPVGSGKNLIVNSIGLAASAASIALVYTIGSQAPTDQTVTRAANKLSGGALGVGQVRVDASGMPVFASNLLRTMACPASDVRDWDVRGAVVVPPGKGLALVGTVLNTQLIVNFEWFEELV